VLAKQQSERPLWHEILYRDSWEQPFIKHLAGQSTLFYFSSSDALRELFGYRVIEEAILIRDEYIEAYDFLMKQDTASQSTRIYPKFVLIGQPGIGPYRVWTEEDPDCLRTSKDR
jgi:hypothetical protein